MPPTFVQEIETAWNTPGPRTTAAFDVVTGDLLVACMVYQYTYANTTSAISNNGSALVWDIQQSTATSGTPHIAIWKTTMEEDRTGLTVTFTPGGTDVTLVPMGANVLRWQDHGGIGNSASVSASVALPSLVITTARDNSAIVVVNGDYLNQDGAGRAWRTGAGALTELTYFHGIYTVYLGYHADAGLEGAKTVGLTLPIDQIYTLAAVEVFEYVADPTPEQTELIQVRHQR